MKILSPAVLLEDIVALTESGCDEFYVGFVPEEWCAEFSILEANRREYEKHNFSSWQELENGIKFANAHNRKIFLTLNKNFYTDAQHQFIIRLLKKLENMGLSGVIVADLALLSLLSCISHNLEIHASTGTAIFNTQAAKFYIEKFNISRIILPRHMLLSEIYEFRRALGENIELEVFILNGQCLGEDGLCRFQHGLNNNRHSYSLGEEGGRPGCFVEYNIELFNPDTMEKVKDMEMEQNWLFWKKKQTDDHLNFCGICAMYYFNKLKINSLKIVGRDHDVERKIRDLNVVTAAKRLLSNNTISFSEYHAECQHLYEMNYGFKCETRCYYSDLAKEENKWNELFT